MGDLDPGTYTTEIFEPRLTYSVPEGWANFEDTPGNFLLVPPGADLPGVDANTSDFVGVYTSVYAQNRECATELQAATAQPGVDTTPEAIANEFAERPGLVTDGPRSVELGGLTGFVLDVRVDSKWTGTCFYYPTPVVQLVGGRDPSALDHCIVAGNAARLYLLGYGDGTLLIEIVDVGNDGSVDSLDSVAKDFLFEA